MNLEDVLLRGLRASQPAASAVAEGQLYSVTDENFIVEQSRGGIWVAYAGSGGGVAASGGQTANFPYLFPETPQYEEPLLIVPTGGVGAPGPTGATGPAGADGTDGIDGTDGADGAGLPLTVEEIDGTPTVANVTKIKVTNGSLTDDGSGVVTITIGAGGAGAMPPILFKPQNNEPPSAAFAFLDTRNVRPVLIFSGSVDTEAIFTGYLPAAYTGNGLTVISIWGFTSATSGNLRVQAAIERNDFSSLDIDADSFASFKSAGGVAPGTSGQFIAVSIGFTSGAEMDNLVASELFRLKIRRDRDQTSGTDDITTTAQLLAVIVKET